MKRPTTLFKRISPGTHFINLNHPARMMLIKIEPEPGALRCRLCFGNTYTAKYRWPTVARVHICPRSRVEIICRRKEHGRKKRLMDLMNGTGNDQEST